jgi:hypothetical protein
MAEARIALGAELDIASGNELDEHFKSLRADIAAGGKPKKIFRPLAKAATFSAAAAGELGILALGHPSAGRIWVVTRLCVMGADDATTVANVTAGLYVGDTTAPALTQCVLTGESVPFTSTQNEHAWIVHDREELYVRFAASAAVASQQIVVTAQAWEYRDRDIVQQAI